jgi:hypothetical protein
LGAVVRLVKVGGMFRRRLILQNFAPPPGARKPVFCLVRHGKRAKPDILAVNDRQSGGE